MGRVVDPETGLQYLRARYYDPSTGQFLTRDPIAASTRDAYGYGARSPLNEDDPRGLVPCRNGIGTPQDNTCDANGNPAYSPPVYGPPAPPAPPRRPDPTWHLAGGLVGNGGVYAGVTNAAGRDIRIVIRDETFFPGTFTVSIGGRGSQSWGSLGLGDQEFCFPAVFGESGWKGDGSIRFNIDWSSWNLTTWQAPFTTPLYGVLVYVKY